jgi:tRNA threonylcarbamoyladenosine biosynthesis protein TsaB
VILAIDTATDWTGLALHDGSALLAEMGWRSRHTQTVELAPAIAQMWQRVGVAAADMRGIAVSIGPGSYTGLRVGLAVAKGLALAHGLPLIGVSTLDIVAAAVGRREGTLLVTAEAGRKRVWAGEYRWQERSGWQPTGTPTLTTWEALLAVDDATTDVGQAMDGARTAVAEPMTVTGEISQEALRLIRLRRSQEPVVPLPPAAAARRAGYLAEIGWQRFKRGRVDRADQLSPVYLREPGS